MDVFSSKLKDTNVQKRWFEFENFLIENLVTKARRSYGVIRVALRLKESSANLKLHSWNNPQFADYKPASSWLQLNSH